MGGCVFQFFTILMHSHSLPEELFPSVAHHYMLEDGKIIPDYVEPPALYGTYLSISDKQLLLPRLEKDGQALTFNQGIALLQCLVHKRPPAEPRAFPLSLVLLSGTLAIAAWTSGHWPPLRHGAKCPSPVLD